MAEREEYFAVNNKPAGVSTSFRVSGKLGECAVRFWDYYDAEVHARRLNAAYRLGLKHRSLLEKPAKANISFQDGKQ